MCECILFCCVYVCVCAFVWVVNRKASLSIWNSPFCFSPAQKWVYTWRFPMWPFIWWLRAGKYHYASVAAHCLFYCYVKLYSVHCVFVCAYKCKLKMIPMAFNVNDNKLTGTQHFISSILFAVYQEHPKTILMLFYLHCLRSYFTLNVIICTTCGNFS